MEIVSMVTAKQINANRVNANKSTGPKSRGGLERSSANALKHGLSAKAFVIDDEDAAEFEKFRKRFVKEWQPEGATERSGVRRLAETYWQLQRAQKAITELLNTEIYQSGVAYLSRFTYARREGPDGLGHFPSIRPEGDESDGSQETASQRIERICKQKLDRLTYGVGAALSDLGPKDQKLATALRYMAHFERAAERIIRNLVFLQKYRGSEEKLAV
jgi:hypothetical protein